MNEKNQKASASSTTTGATTGSRTSQGLGSLNLTDIIAKRGGQVPGISAEQQTTTLQSLYHVQEVPIADILDSDYQTREAVSPARFKRLVKSLQEEKPTEFKDAIPVRPHPTHEGKWQVARGGHTRLKAAIEAGLTTYPVIVVKYDNRRSALGIARENLARGEEYTPPEEGRLYLILKKEFGYNQEELAQELEISKDRIKECEAAAQSAPDILEMFSKIKAIGGDTSRGLRAAKCLRRLDILDEKYQQPTLAARLRIPLIEAFIYERLTTDGLDIATKRIVQSDNPEAIVAALIWDLNRSDEQTDREDSTVPTSSTPTPVKKELPAPEIQRSEKLSLAIRRFRQFTTLISDYTPSDDERRILTSLRTEIDTLLNR